MFFVDFLQIFFHPLLRLNLISAEDHCKIFGNIQIILGLHEGELSNFISLNNTKAVEGGGGVWSYI